MRRLAPSVIRSFVSLTVNSGPILPQIPCHTRPLARSLTFLRPLPPRPAPTSPRIRHSPSPTGESPPGIHHTLRFCIYSIIKQFCLCSGDISPKQKHNAHINSCLQKRRSRKSGPGRTWHRSLALRGSAAASDLRPRAMGLSDGVLAAGESGSCPAGRGSGSAGGLLRSRRTEITVSGSESGVWCSRPERKLWRPGANGVHFALGRSGRATGVAASSPQSSKAALRP